MKLFISVFDLSGIDITENFVIHQLTTTKPNISFYLSPQTSKDEYQDNDRTINIKIQGIDNSRLEHLKNIGGHFYIKEPSGLYKKSFYEVIDITLLNLFSGLSENSLTIPFKLKKEMVSISCFLEMVTSIPKNIEKIAVVGMKHVGSTLLVNILRTAYRLLGRKLNDENKNEDEEVIVTKSHTILPQWIEKHYILITVIRDVRDASISGFLRFIYQQSINKDKSDETMKETIQKYGIQTFLDYMYHNLQLFYDSLEYNPIIFKYEEYKSQPISTVKKLFTELNIYCSEPFLKEVIDIAESIKDKEDLYHNLHDWQVNCVDKKIDKLLTRDHNTSEGKTKKYKTFFSEEQNKIILKDPFVMEFLQEYNYMKDDDDN